MWKRTVQEARVREHGNEHIFSLDCNKCTAAYVHHTRKSVKKWTDGTGRSFALNRILLLCIYGHTAKHWNSASAAVHYVFVVKLLFFSIAFFFCSNVNRPVLLLPHFFSCFFFLRRFTLQLKSNYIMPKNIVVCTVVTLHFTVIRTIVQSSGRREKSSDRRLNEISRNCEISNTLIKSEALSLVK